MTIPVITIDGPGGSGKGTISIKVAQDLGWHYLDSGALYRILALKAVQQSVDLADEVKLVELVRELVVEFGAAADDSIRLDGEEVSLLVRDEKCGNWASLIASIPAVREALLRRQQVFRQAPGLVADGRDMGTVVFSDAGVKIFLTASAEERAQRRYKQLIAKGIDVTLTALLLDIKERDTRDTERAISPLKPASDAVIIDTTRLSIDQVVSKVLEVAS